MSDYLAEIFAELRRLNFQTHVAARVDLSRLTGRNQDSIKKTAAGYLKLLHPHRTPEDVADAEIKECLDLAIEMRHRVTDQLAVMLPGEFGAVSFDYAMR